MEDWQSALGLGGFGAPRPTATSGNRMRETLSFGANPGELRMWSFVPDGLARGAPLVVVLHGCTQTAEAHAEAAGWLTLAERVGFAVLAPEQRSANNPNRCFNWFQPDDAARDRGEAASIRNMVGAMVSAEGLDPSRVFVTGLSAGGAMASILLATYPEVFAAGAIIAGLPFGAATSMQNAFQAMQGRGPSDADLIAALRLARPAGADTPRVSIWHGDADYTVNFVNAEAIAKQWVSAHLINYDAGVTEVQGKVKRTSWRAVAGGDVLVESNIIKGLGHGTPLATSGPDGVGVVAPFMLEVEISAATAIAEFWKLTDAKVPAPLIDAESSFASAPPKSKKNVADVVMASIAQHVPREVEAVISAALKRAGLMR